MAKFEGIIPGDKPELNRQLSDGLQGDSEYDTNEASRMHDLYDEVEQELDIDDGLLDELSDTLYDSDKSRASDISKLLTLLRREMSRSKSKDPVRRALRRGPAAPDVRLGAGAAMVIGWLRSGEIVAPPTASKSSASVQVTSSPRRHPYRNIAEFMRSWMAIMAAYYQKTYSQAVVAVAGAATTFTLTQSGGGFAGIIINVTDSLNNANFAPVELTVATKGVAGGAIIQTNVMLYQPQRPASSVALMLPTNFGGMGQLAKWEEVVVTVAADKLRAGATISGQTINSFDIRY